MLLKRGAEAELRRTTYLGRQAVEKVRVPKGYRLPALDDDLRRSRIRREKTPSVESKGVGLRLLTEALTSAHASGPRYLGAVARAYRRAYPRAAEVLAKAKEIGERGRYT